MVPLREGRPLTMPELQVRHAGRMLRGEEEEQRQAQTLQGKAAAVPGTEKPQTKAESEKGQIANMQVGRKKGLEVQ